MHPPRHFINKFASYATWGISYFMPCKGSDFFWLFDCFTIYFGLEICDPVAFFVKRSARPLEVLQIIVNMNWWRRLNRIAALAASARRRREFSYSCIIIHKSSWHVLLVNPIVDQANSLSSFPSSLWKGHWSHTQGHFNIPTYSSTPLLVATSREKYAS